MPMLSELWRHTFKAQMNGAQYSCIESINVKGHLQPLDFEHNYSGTWAVSGVCNNVEISLLVL